MLIVLPGDIHVHTLHTYILKKQGWFFNFFTTNSMYLLDMKNKRTDSLMIIVIDTKVILMVSLNYPQR